MLNLETFSYIFLILFTIVASFDGLYLHLYKYRLFARKQSIREHKLHTINTFLFPITIFFLFVINSSGFFLWLAVFFTAVTIIIEFIDVFEEHKSRIDLGGLTSFEYSMHFGMFGMRATYTTLVLANKHAESWNIFAPLIAPQLNTNLLFQTIGACIFIVGVLIFFVHYYLGKAYQSNKNAIL